MTVARGRRVSGARVVPPTSASRRNPRELLVTADFSLLSPPSAARCRPAEVFFSRENGTRVGPPLLIHQSDKRAAMFITSHTSRRPQPVNGFCEQTPTGGVRPAATTAALWPFPPPNIYKSTERATSKSLVYFSAAPVNGAPSLAPGRKSQKRLIFPPALQKPTMSRLHRP